LVNRLTIRSQVVDTIEAAAEARTWLPVEYSELPSEHAAGAEALR
jgi:hypothetical protein